MFSQYVNSNITQQDKLTQLGGGKQLGIYKRSREQIQLVARRTGLKPKTTGLRVCCTADRWAAMVPPLF